MRDVYKVLREKEKDLEQLHLEVQALRLTARLLNESGDSPAAAACQGSDIEGNNTEVGEAMTVAKRLRIVAAPLLAVFAR